MTYLTVPMAATDIDKVMQQIEAAQAAGAEMLELRTDYLENLSGLMVKKLVADVKNATGGRLPIIVTCRDKQQGGAISYPDALRIKALVSAVEAGAEFIDFEYEKFVPTENREKIEVALAKSYKTRLILSAHNFEANFADISRLYRRIQSTYSAAIAKLVYRANHINDCFDALDLLNNTSSERIIFCMGQAGLITRILAKKFGSFVTFASIDDEKATAPGQLTIEHLRNLYRYESIDSDTELYGVIGSPIAHSLSPAIHNACFGGIDANKLYLPLLVEGGKNEFDKFMRDVLSRKWLGFKGFSVTIPHKANALNFVKERQDFVEPLAEKIGAVNTLLISGDNRLKGYNTDYGGALDAITSILGKKRSVLEGLPVAVIGAGGVARAIVAALKDAGAIIKIYNRTLERGEKLAADFSCEFAPLDELSGVDAKLLINCTSIGMHPNVEETPVAKENLKKGMAVFDTVYNPARTMLLKQAKRKRLKTIDGLSMFINQAAAQFKLFTSKKPNTKLMRKGITGCLSKK